LVLAEGDEAKASEYLADILRATSCWNTDRSWTIEMIRNDQIIPNLDELGLLQLEGRSWEEYVITLTDPTSEHLLASISGGTHDSRLLSRAVVCATTDPTLFVTNDEALLLQARQWRFESPTSGLSSTNSTSMMLALLDCGAITEDVVYGCLTAEHRNLELMRRGGMANNKYERKHQRLTEAGQQLAMRTYDSESSTTESER
jgi:hypothetical protein